jgi:hypothetical protein
MRAILLIVGVLALLMGLLWIGQGLGLIMWPSSSSMLADRHWAMNGAVVALAGAALIWLFGRRRSE